MTDLSDFETVMYGIEPDKYYLIATSEHPLTAMRMDEVIEPSELPIKMVGVSPCFRREVGAHGLSDRGIWRVHQFTKVEQIVICDPEESWGHHEDLLTNAVDMWDSLGLHYRVVNICTGDMGTVAARKYDLEAWLPGAWRLQGGRVMLQLHGLPGEQAQDEVQDLGGQLRCPHPELHRDCDQQGAGRDHGAEPARGWDSVGPGGSETLHGR